LDVYGPISKEVTMLLETIVYQVATECDLAKCTIKQYEAAERRFSAFLQRPATTDDLSHSTVNAFLASLKLEATTIRNYRVCLTRIWNYAVEVYHIEGYDIKRLRRPKIAKKPVWSWTSEQITQLLRGCDELIGRLKIGIKQCDFMRAVVLFGYDTGLRPIDCRLVTWDAIDFAQRRICITQHKTNEPHVARMNDITHDAIRKIERPQRDRIFPLDKGGMRRLELMLFAESARFGFVRRKGQGLGTLRKSHATSIYIQEGENAAAESLGHVGGTRTVKASYIDHRAKNSGRLPPLPFAS
jgi:integrase